MNDFFKNQKYARSIKELIEYHSCEAFSYIFDKLNVKEMDYESDDYSIHFGRSPFEISDSETCKEFKDNLKTEMLKFLKEANISQIDEVIEN